MRRADRAAGDARQRQDARHQAAARRRHRHQDPARRPGPAGPGRQWRRDRRDHGQAAPLLQARGQQYPARPARLDRRGGARRQGPRADGRRAGDAEHSQGLELGQGAAPQGQGLHRQGRRARRPARHPDGRRARRCRARQVPRRLERPRERRTPGRGSAFSAPCAKSPPNPRKHGASASPGPRRISGRSAASSARARAPGR